MIPALLVAIAASIVPQFVSFGVGSVVGCCLVGTFRRASFVLRLGTLKCYWYLLALMLAGQFGSLVGGCLNMVVGYKVAPR